MDLEKIEPGMKLRVTREIIGLAENDMPVVAEENKSDKGTLIIGKTGMVMCQLGLGKSLFFRAEDLKEE